MNLFFLLHVSAKCAFITGSKQNSKYRLNEVFNWNLFKVSGLTGVQLANICVVQNLFISQNCEKQLLALSSLSVRTEQIGSHWMDFYKTLYLRDFRKRVDEIQVLLKYEKK